VAYISAVTAGAPLDIGAFLVVLSWLISGGFWCLSGFREGRGRLLSGEGCGAGT
jgi:hypothetical protein